MTTEIVLQADIGGVTIAFTESVGGVGIDGRLDALMKSISRQRAQAELVEAMIDLRSRHDTLEQFPDLLSEFRKRRAEERVRQVEQFRAMHDAANRRGEFRMTDAQRKGLEQFDAQTGVDEKRLHDEREKCMREIPLYQTKVARQRAIIAGADRATLLEVPLAEAAE